METDASTITIGVVLMESGHPIAFISKVISVVIKVSRLMKNKLLAILFVVMKRQYYLTNRHLIIRTNQQSFKLLLEQKVSTPLQHTWLAKLLGFDYEIEYK